MMREQNCSWYGNLREVTISQKYRQKCTRFDKSWRDRARIVKSTRVGISGRELVRAHIWWEHMIVDDSVWGLRIAHCVSCCECSKCDVKALELTTVLEKAGWQCMGVSITAHENLRKLTRVDGNDGRARLLMVLYESSRDRKSIDKSVRV